MTQKAINEQLEAIKRVSEEVLKSKESARQFLIDAGIIKVPNKDASATTKNSRSNK